MSCTRLRVEDVDDVVRWSALTSGQQVSLFAISYSGGMVITAAAVPEFADYVKMISAFRVITASIGLAGIICMMT
jgi:hypothetical protein